jgi:putative DNA primase/helicase
MSDRIDVADLRPALAAAAAEIAQAILGPPNRTMSNKRELRFGRHGSLAVVIAGPKAGLWRDHSDDSGGDMLALIQRERRCTFQEALIEAAALVGGAKPQRSPVTGIVYQDEIAAIEERRAVARQIWHAAYDFFGSPSQLYLENRGIEISPNLDEAIRFHPGLRFGDAVYPAMVAAITDIHSDELIGVHLTAIDKDGHPIKVEGKTLRRIRGSKKGGCIKLSPDYEVIRGLLIGEGIETTLSAMAIEQAQGWCVLDAGELRSFPVLAGIECLTIAVDADQAGIQAAKETTARWIAARREVIRLVPKQSGTDFNDIIRSVADERS